MLRRLAVLGMLGFVHAAAHAQGTARDTARTSAVVVTATRSELARERVPEAVTVLDGAQLRREGITSVADALRQVPGVALAQSASYGTATSLFIRGGESKFTKVLVDGVAVNEAGGAFDFSALSTDNVERIEVVRGPSSVLYGSDAVAGVVQIFTRRGTRGVHADLSARGGGFGSSDIEGSARGAGTPGASAVDWSVSAARHRTDGYQAFNSGFMDQTGSALVRAARGAVDGQLSLHYADLALHFPTDGSGQVVDSNAVHREDRLALGLDGGVRLSSAFAVRGMFASNDVHAVTDDQPDSPGDTQGYYYSTADRTRRRSGDVRLVATLPRAQVTVGGQVEHEWQGSATTSNFGDNGFTAARRATGVYGQLLLEPSERITATLGSRYERNERFGRFLTWRAAASTRLGAQTRLHASAGTAFREPTFLENFGSDFVVGNPALKPEHSFSVDAGVEQKVGDALILDATVFANSFRDLIDYLYSTTEPNYFNLARTRTRGLELDGRLTLPAGLHADAAFTYLDARVASPGASAATVAAFAPDARLLRRPMHTLDIGVGYRVTRAALDVRARRVGERDDVFFAPDFSSSRVSLPAYTRVDLSGELSLRPNPTSSGNAALTLRIENLFDAHYTEVAGVNYEFANTDADALRLTGYRAAPRRALVGLRLSH